MHSKSNISPDNFSSFPIVSAPISLSYFYSLSYESRTNLTGKIPVYRHNMTHYGVHCITFQVLAYPLENTSQEPLRILAGTIIEPGVFVSKIKSKIQQYLLIMGSTTHRIKRYDKNSLKEDYVVIVINKNVQLQCFLKRVLLPEVVVNF